MGRLRRKLKKAKAADDTQEAARLASRIQLREIRLGKAASYGYAAARFALGFFGIPLPPIKRSYVLDSLSTQILKETKIELDMNKFKGPSGFIAEMILRMFAEKPRFFIWAQRITGALGVVLAALKYFSDPAYGFPLYDPVCILSWCFVPEVGINYAIAACVAVIGALQLPNRDINEKKTQA